jgi:hypothetical protein
MEDGGALHERADSGTAGGEDHGIIDRFFLPARASPSHCSCAVFQRYSVSCQSLIRKALEVIVIS